MSDSLWRAIVGVGLIVAIGAIALAVRSSDSDGGDLLVQAVEAVQPRADDQVLRQSRIGIDLAPGYTGVLIINGVEIPDDQLERVDPLNQVFFTPGEGKEIEELEPGPVCVVAPYWKIGSARAEGQSTQWCFDVS